MKNIKAFLCIFSIVLLVSCSPKEESPDLAVDTTNTGGGGTGGGGTGGGGTGGGGTGGGGTGGGGPIVTEIFKADVAGAVTGSFNATYIHAYDSAGFISIDGYDANYSIGIKFDNTTTTGGSMKNGNTFLLDKATYDIYPLLGGSNSVSISNIDKVNHTIKGTFYFDGGLGTKANITGGIFEVNYTVK